MPALPDPASQTQNSAPAPIGLRTLAVRPAHVAAAAVLGLIAAFYSLSPLWHSDVWGHLAYAAAIARDGRLPRTEPFCDFADKQTPLVHFAWLGELLMLACFRLGEWLAGGDELRRLAGGVAGLRTLTVVAALLFCWQLLTAYARASRSLALAVAGLAAYSLLAPTALGVLRPQVFGMILFAFLLARLSAGEWGWRDVALTLAAFVLWVNLHGSFVVGLGLLGIFLLGRVLSLSRAAGRWALAAPWRDGSVRRLALTVAAGAVLTAVANPHGPVLFLAVSRFASHPVTRQFDEFRPLDLELGPGALYLYLASVAILLGSWLLARWRPTPTQLLIVLVFGLTPIGQRRLLMWWMPLLPWLVVPAWAELARRRGWAWATEPGTPHPRHAFLVGLIVLMALPWTPPARALVGGPAPLPQSVTPVTPWRLARQLDGGEADYPRLASALQQHYPEGRFRGRIFASETLGDFLVWQAPQYPLVVYSHSHVLTIDFWDDVMRVKRGDPGWDECLDRWGVNLIVVEAATHPHLREAVRKDPRWSVVADDLSDPNASRVPGNWLFIAIRKQPLPPQ
jgi:hypothetical protein